MVLHHDGGLISAAQAGLAQLSEIPSRIFTASVLVFSAAYLSRRRLAEICRQVLPTPPSIPWRWPTTAPGTPQSLSITSPSRERNYACGFLRLPHQHLPRSTPCPPGEAKARPAPPPERRRVQKLNIAGGEPFLHPRCPGDDPVVQPRTSWTSRAWASSLVGARCARGFLRENDWYLDILAVSCDSFVPETKQGHRAR